MNAVHQNQTLDITPRSNPVRKDETGVWRGSVTINPNSPQLRKICLIESKRSNTALRP
jgi:hypothetical protein